MSGNLRSPSYGSLRYRWAVECEARCPARAAVEVLIYGQWFRACHHHGREWIAHLEALTDDAWNQAPTNGDRWLSRS